MNRSSRHILLIFLCLVSALPMFLSAFFLGGRILIRKTMLEKLSSSETVILRLPANALHWYEKDHELLIDGRMFDVKSIRTTDYGYEVTGLFDDDETELFDQLVKTESGRQQGHGQPVGLFQSCLGIIADIPDASPTIGHNWLLQEQDFLQSASDPVLHMLRAVETPPPDSVS